MRVLTLAIAMLLALNASAEPRFDLAARPTAYGLYPVLDTELDRVYARIDAGLPWYRSVHVAPVSIAWRRNPEAPTAQPDPARIEEMRRYFHSALERAVGSTGYALVPRKELGALELRTSIIDVRPGAGEVGPYLESVAEMTMVLELADATTGELLVQVADSRTALRSSDGEGPATTREAVTALLDGWADHVGERLEQIRRLGASLGG